MMSKVAIWGVIAVARDDSDLQYKCEKLSIWGVIEIAREDSDL